MRHTSLKPSSHLKVMLVCGSAPPMPCGVGDYTMRLAEALAKEGHQVSLLTSTSAGKREDPHLEILPIMPDWRFGRWRRLFQAFRRQRPDLVHLQFPAQGFTGSLLPALIPVLAFLAGARVVRTWHEVTTWDDVRNWRGVVILILQTLAPGRNLSVRPDLRERVHRLLRPLLGRIRYVQSAATMPFINLTVDQRQKRHRELLDGADRLIIFFGFINAAKGIEDVLMASDPLRDRIIFVGGYDPQSTIVQSLIAAGEDGPWRDRITLTGFIAPTAAAEYMAVADAVLLPFKDGGGDWNSSLQAATAQGTLTITTTRGAPGFDSDKNLVRVAIGDVAAMRDALDTYAGRRVCRNSDLEWARVARDHIDAYSR